MDLAMDFGEEWDSVSEEVPHLGLMLVGVEEDCLDAGTPGYMQQRLTGQRCQPPIHLMERQQLLLGLRPSPQR